MYKSTFITCMKEKFGRLYFLYYILIGIIILLVDETISFGVSSAIILFTAIQVARMFSLKEISCINNGFYRFRRQQSIYIFILASLADLPWLVFLVVKMLLIQSYYVIPMMLIWFYLTILGMILGKYIQNEVINYGIVLLLFFFCLQKTVIHELYFRYISPVLVFRGEINIFNIVGIGLLSVAGLFILFASKSRIRITFSGTLVICLCILTMVEFRYESHINNKELVSVTNKEYTVDYNSVLSKDMVEHVSEVIFETEKTLNNYGFELKTSNYNMSYSIYFPWESSQQKILIMNNDGICNINFYTDSLLEISDEELITRYIYSVLNTDTQLQEIARELLVDDVIAQVVSNKRSSQIQTFLYDNLVENYGYCASPKQCAVAECLKESPEDFSSIYNLFGEAASLNAIDIEAVSINDNYKQIFRRIIE